MPPKSKGAQKGGAGRKRDGKLLPSVCTEPPANAQEQIKRLEAQVAHLQAAVLARDTIIAKMQRRAEKDTSGGSDASGSNCTNNAGVPWVVVSADVYLSHWCDEGLVPYGELIRFSLVCRSIRRKTLECMQLLRRLDFRKDLLWPLGECQRLQVVINAVGQMGGGLVSLDLSALGKLTERHSLTLVSGLAPLKGGQLKELIMPGIMPFKTVTSLLATLGSLQDLDLSKNTLGDDGAIELASVLGELRGLRRLDLGGKNNIGSNGCRALAAKFGSLPSLQELLLANNNMCSTGCHSLTNGLKDMTALQVLDLTGNQIKDLGKNGAQVLGAALGGLGSLHTLRLGNTNFNFVGEHFKAMWLRGFLSTIPLDGGQLLRLSVQRNNFHTEGCAALAKVLPRLPSLQELDLSENDITADGMRHLAVAFIGMPLQELNLGENDLGPDGARLLAGVLDSLPKLARLDLTDNELGDGVVELAEGLPDTLTLLALACNKMRNRGIVAISKVLHRLPALKELLLEENDISDEGVVALAEHLPDSKNLACLDLIRNKIGDTGCSALTGVVGAMPALQKLLLGENFIGEVGCMALASALATLTALNELDLGGNRIGKDASAVLFAIARKNRGLCMRLEDQDEEADHSHIDDGEGEDDDGIGLEEDDFADFWGMPGEFPGLFGLGGGANEDDDDDDDYEDEDVDFDDASSSSSNSSSSSIPSDSDGED